MNYREDMEKSLDYIEAHLDAPLTAEAIAAGAGYSLYHFCRVFALYYGLPLMEYVRRRRLSLAAAAIAQGEKALDAALRYGFETASGFSKAFRRTFGCSPTQYASRPVDGEKRGIFMSLCKPRITDKPAFLVAGYGIRTDIARAGYMRDVASFWEHYDGENLECKLYELLKPPKHGEIGLCVPHEGTCAGYLLGVIVEDFSKAAPEMIQVTVPAARYAVFTTPPVDTSNDPEQKEFAKVIRETWRAIFEEWFPESGFCYDENGLDFEYYDERCHGRVDTVMEIYVPILEK